MCKKRIYTGFSICLVSLILFISSCTKKENLYQARKNKLKNIADKINTSFIKYVLVIDSLAEFTEDLYNKESRKDILPKVNKNAYKISKNGVFYKPDFKSSAVFVSGVIPIDSKIKNIVYFTEPLEKEFQKICDNNPNIVQVYYNDEHSYNRIYPGFNVLIQYKAKMDIPSFNFYFLADEKHNPSKKSVWINEVYVDPAGRGWMISLIKPVYYDDVLKGVVGLDITVNEIINAFFTDLSKNYMIISPSGMVVAFSESLSPIFHLPSIISYKYFETISSDTLLSNRYNLLKSKKKKIRILAEKLLKDKKGEFEFSDKGKEFIILEENIALLNWRIVTVIEKPN
jgi:hypothetical protein